MALKSLPTGSLPEEEVELLAIGRATEVEISAEAMMAKMVEKRIIAVCWFDWVGRTGKRRWKNGVAVSKE